MQIHDITKRRKTNEGLLSGIKDAITAAQTGFNAGASAAPASPRVAGTAGAAGALTSPMAGAIASNQNALNAAEKSRQAINKKLGLSGDQEIGKGPHRGAGENYAGQAQTKAQAQAQTAQVTQQAQKVTQQFTQTPEFDDLSAILPDPGHILVLKNTGNVKVFKDETGKWFTQPEQGNPVAMPPDRVKWAEGEVDKDQYGQEASPAASKPGASAPKAGLKEAVGFNRAALAKASKKADAMLNNTVLAKKLKTNITQISADPQVKTAVAKAKTDLAKASGTTYSTDRSAKAKKQKVAAAFQKYAQTALQGLSKVSQDQGGVVAPGASSNNTQLANPIERKSAQQTLISQGADPKTLASMEKLAQQGKGELVKQAVGLSEVAKIERRLKEGLLDLFKSKDNEPELPDFDEPTNDVVVSTAKGDYIKSGTDGKWRDPKGTVIDSTKYADYVNKLEARAQQQDSPDTADNNRSNNEVDFTHGGGDKIRGKFGDFNNNKDNIKSLIKKIKGGNATKKDITNYVKVYDFTNPYSLTPDDPKKLNDPELISNIPPELVTSLDGVANNLLNSKNISDAELEEKLKDYTGKWLYAVAHTDGKLAQQTQSSAATAMDDEMNKLFANNPNAIDGWNNTPYQQHYYNAYKNKQMSKKELEDALLMYASAYNWPEDLEPNDELENVFLTLPNKDKAAINAMPSAQQKLLALQKISNEQDVEHANYRAQQTQQQSTDRLSPQLRDVMNHRNQQWAAQGHNQQVQDTFNQLQNAKIFKTGQEDYLKDRLASLMAMKEHEVKIIEKRLLKELVSLTEDQVRISKDIIVRTAGGNYVKKASDQTWYDPHGVAIDPEKYADYVKKLDGTPQAQTQYQADANKGMTTSFQGTDAGFKAQKAAAQQAPAPQAPAQAPAPQAAPDPVQQIADQQKMTAILRSRDVAGLNAMINDTFNQLQNAKIFNTGQEPYLKDRMAQLMAMKV